MNPDKTATIKPFGRNEAGFSLLEVMIAMVILAFSMLGVVGMFQWGDYGAREGATGTRALAMAQARIEAKRTLPWDRLLADDIDLDGVTDVVMRDDGIQPDITAGDNIFTAGTEQNDIRLIWTVQPNRIGPLAGAGMAVIQSRASYQVGNGSWRDIKIGTLRVNPNYVGAH